MNLKWAVRMILVVGIMLYINMDCFAAAVPNVGDRAPQITISAENGDKKDVITSDKITVLNFWATWCPPCRHELPEINQFAQKYADKVNFYAIASEDQGTVQNFMKRNNYSFPVLYETNASVSSAYVVRAIPTTIVIDKTGIIRFRTLGGVTMAELENAIAGL